jgi:hypothetical protein
MTIRNFDEIQNFNEASDWEVINSFYRFGGFNERLEYSLPLEKLLRSDEEIDKIIYNKLDKITQ